jgi:FKBP-type peptidyl-prolyl cis-trans isomerase
MNPMFRTLAATLVAAVPVLSLRAAVPQEPTPAPAPAQGGIPECKEMTTTSSGLQIGFLKKGDGGVKPKPDDNVEVHYTGWFPDGKKFDSSRDKGQPAQFAVNGVIKGWTEALQLMSAGDRCKLVIPGDLAYGPQGRPGIPPNATLVFDVELLKVKSMPTLKPADPKQQKEVANGLKYERTTVGTGSPLLADGVLTMRYAVWGNEGKLVDCSERQNDARITAAIDKMRFPFLTTVLKDAAATGKVGDVMRVEVPKEQFPNVGSDTVWELEVLACKPKPDAPKFRELDKSKIVTTQSGLQYEVLASGTGDSPTAADTVVVHYSGWLTDGTPFDSSYERGETIEFPLRGVIPGWTEGVQLMKPGGKFLFQIPSKLGYGEHGQPPTIPGNATLVFLVELIEVKKR